MSDQPKKPPDYLWGKLFVRPHGMRWQWGRIDRRINDSHYLIELYSADREMVHMTIAAVASMIDWQLYDHNTGVDAWKNEVARLSITQRGTNKENS